MKFKFFDLAKKLSKKSDYHHKIGSVIVKKNRILGVGFNKPYKTSPHSNHPFRTIHAELDAILDANKEDLKGSTIYVYRELRNGKIASAKPCAHCQELLKRYEIKRVFYTDEGTYKEYLVC